ncbi:uncharacterized protein LOC106160221 [Lingula anatina]|uniref:Uncharacterized protein LOC106160221 n=1 Tax=Lingula anatina TaxID=7574 RepID=A0A1S3I301_LINAN|nr:uncharacterized protein LOC106160221 [Lingula anatina]|eukprot:XP_013392211.1 uncharacterized protein LOC106160221 [Lingula anatina]
MDGWLTTRDKNKLPQASGDSSCLPDAKQRRILSFLQVQPKKKARSSLADNTSLLKKTEHSTFDLQTNRWLPFNRTQKVTRNHFPDKYDTSPAVHRNDRHVSNIKGCSPNDENAEIWKNCSYTKREYSHIPIRETSKKETNSAREGESSHFLNEKNNGRDLSENTEGSVLNFLERGRLRRKRKLPSSENTVDDDVEGFSLLHGGEKLIVPDVQDRIIQHLCIDLTDEDVVSKSSPNHNTNYMKNKRRKTDDDNDIQSPTPLRTLANNPGVNSQLSAGWRIFSSEIDGVSEPVDVTECRLPSPSYMVGEEFTWNTQNLFSSTGT